MRVLLFTNMVQHIGILLSRHNALESCSPRKILAITIRRIMQWKPFLFKEDIISHVNYFRRLGEGLDALVRCDTVEGQFLLLDPLLHFDELWLFPLRDIHQGVELGAGVLPLVDSLRFFAAVRT